MQSTAPQIVAPATTPGAESFTKLPEGLSRDGRIPITARGRAVLGWCGLNRIGKGQPVIKASYAEIAAHLGVSPKTVQRFMGDLELYGWVNVLRRPGTKAHSVRGWFSLNTAVPDHPLPEFRSPGLRAVPAAEPADTPAPSGGTGQSRGEDRTVPPSRAVPGLREVLKGEGPPPPSNADPEPHPAPTATGQPFPRHCPAHADHPAPPPCGACADARKTHAAAARAAATRSRSDHPDVRCELHRLDHAANAECRSCRAERLAVPDGGPHGPAGCTSRSRMPSDFRARVASARPAARGRHDPAPGRTR